MEQEYQHLQQEVLRKCTELNQMRERHREQESPATTESQTPGAFTFPQIPNQRRSFPGAGRTALAAAATATSPNGFSLSSPRLAVAAAALARTTATTGGGAALETSTTETRAAVEKLRPDSGAENQPQSVVPRISPFPVPAYPPGGVVARC